MTTELLLTAIIIALIVAFSWYIREQGQERTKLINAILAKDSQDYVNRTLAENTKIEPEINGPQDPELVPMDQLTDEAFDAHIQSTLDNQPVDQEVA